MLDLLADIWEGVTEITLGFLAGSADALLSEAVPWVIIALIVLGVGLLIVAAINFPLLAVASLAMCWFAARLRRHRSR